MPTCFPITRPELAARMPGANAEQALLGIEVVHFCVNGTVGRTRVVALCDFLHPLHRVQAPAMPG